MWVGVSGQFKGRGGFSGRVGVFENEVLLLLVEEFFPRRSSASVGIFFLLHLL